MEGAVCLVDERAHGADGGHLCSACAALWPDGYDEWIQLRRMHIAQMNGGALFRDAQHALDVLRARRGVSGRGDGRTGRTKGRKHDSH